MATFTAIKNRGGGSGALGGVLRYTQQEKKTMWEGRQLVSGWNCTARSAHAEMRLTKERFRKIDGRQYYHFVQSFGAEDGLSPQEVHAIGLELAQREFPDFEVLVATHVDTEHPHNHLMVNSVSFRSGRKLHQSAADLQAHRMANDEICVAHGLEILPPPQKQVKQKRMSTREYRSAAKGQSWKFRLMNTIDQCMKYAATKEDFISLMESEGYQVRWTEGRKNITYTTPQGMKCRDDRLHETKYIKEVMEHEFRIRAEIVHGGIEAVEPDPGSAGRYSGARAGFKAGLGRFAGDSQRPVPVGENPEQPAEQAGEPQFGPHSLSAGGFRPGGEPPHPGADGGSDAGCGPNAGGTATGWEEARDFCFSAQSPVRSVGADLAGPAPAGGHGGHGALADDLVRLGRALERDQDSGPIRDATTMHAHADHKLLQRERQKKIALGHKEDDHEDEQTWQQSM